MKILLKITGVLLTLAIFVGTLFFLYNKSREKPVIYKTMSPFVTTIIKKAVATGAVVPRNEIEIKPQVSGVVEEIYVEAGDMLKKGDLISRFIGTAGLFGWIAVIISNFTQDSFALPFTWVILGMCLGFDQSLSLKSKKESGGTLGR